MCLGHMRPEHVCELEMCLGDDVSGSVCVYTVYTRYVLVFKVCMCARERACRERALACVGVRALHILLSTE